MKSHHTGPKNYMARRARYRCPGRPPKVYAGLRHVERHGRPLSPPVERFKPGPPRRTGPNYKGLLEALKREPCVVGGPSSSATEYVRIRIIYESSTRAITSDITDNRPPRSTITAGYGQW